jgi:topoisomerase-4 subunit A
MKAMGNRLSQHPIKSVELISDGAGITEVETVPVEEEASEPSDINADQPAKSHEEPPTEPASKSAESPEQPANPPPKKIDFEITNPDDIDIDDQGQLGLF